MKSKLKHSYLETIRTFESVIFSTHSIVKVFQPIIDGYIEVLSEKNIFNNRTDYYGNTLPKDLEDYKNLLGNSFDQESLDFVLNKYLNIAAIVKENQTIIYRAFFINAVNQFELFLHDLANINDLDFFADSSQNAQNFKLKTGYSTKAKKLNNEPNDYKKNILEFILDVLHIDLDDRLVNWDLIKDNIAKKQGIINGNVPFPKSNSILFSSDSEVAINYPKKDDLIIDKEYFCKALSEILVASQILFQKSWRISPNYSKKTIDFYLTDSMFQLLKIKEWHNVEVLWSYSKKIKFFRREQLLRAHINYCIALKRQNKIDLVKKEISLVKFDKLPYLLKLAYKILEEDLDEIIKLFNEIIDFHGITIEQYHDWPLFADLREDSTNNALIEQLFKREID